MKAPQSAHLLPLLFLAVVGGCQGPQLDFGNSMPPRPADLAPSVSTAQSGGLDLLGDPILSRGVSAEEPDSELDFSRQRSTFSVPGEVQTLPLNPVFDLLRGNVSSQREDEAYQTLGLLGLTGMIHVTRGLSHSGGRHGLHQVADFTDDLLQPDEEGPRGKLPPFAFGLEWKY